MPQTIRKALMGFAAGVMVAASVWSLLIPSDGILPPRQGDEGTSCYCGIFFSEYSSCFVLTTLRLTSISTVNVPDRSAQPPFKNIKTGARRNNPQYPGRNCCRHISGRAIDESAIMSMSGAMALAIGISIQKFSGRGHCVNAVRELGNSRKKVIQQSGVERLV